MKSKYTSSEDIVFDEQKKIFKINLIEDAFNKFNYFKCHLPNFRTISFDLESISKNRIAPIFSESSIIQIGVVAESYDVNNNDEPSSNNKKINVIFTVNNVSKMDNIDEFCFDTEKELLMNWLKFLEIYDPDVIVGYNIISFDLRLIKERLTFYNLDDTYFDFSCKPFNKRTIVIDVMRQIKYFSNYRWRKLNEMALNFLNDQKNDIDYDDLYDLQLFSNDSRKKIATYCVQDCDLNLRLFINLGIFQSLIFFSKHSCISIDNIINYEKRKIMKMILFLKVLSTNCVLKDYFEKFKFIGIKITSIFYFIHDLDYYQKISDENHIERHLHYFLTLEGIKLLTTTNFTKNIVVQILDIEKIEIDHNLYL